MEKNTNLKIALFEEGITQSKLSSATGVPRSYISMAIILFILTAVGIGFFYLKKPKQVPNEDLMPVKTELAVKTSVLNILTQPEGATLYIDGVHKGNTPLKVKTVYGRHEVRIVLDWYFDQEFQLNVAQAEIHLSRRLISI